jgi:hypothetical protein
MNPKFLRQIWAIAIAVLVGFSSVPGQGQESGRITGQDYEPPNPPFILPPVHEMPTGGGFLIPGGPVVTLSDKEKETGNPRFEAEAPVKMKKGQKAQPRKGVPEAGIPRLLLEIQGSPEAAPVGAYVTYSIRITNTAAESLADVVLAASIPPSLEFKKAKGPSRFHLTKNEVIFDALPALKPQADLYYEMAFRAIRKGDVWFKARASSLHSEDADREMEHTAVKPKN